MHPLISDLSGKTTEELLKTINDMYKKMAFANRMGNAAMKQQLQMVMANYQQEYQKRIAVEVKAAEDNPIFKDSLDIG
jgi:hypothetical protein